MRAPATLVCLEDLVVKREGQTVLEVDYLEVHGGEVLSILGPNGAGKSTLLRVLALLESPSSGRMLWDGRVVDSSRQRLALRRETAMVFQTALLYQASVWENVATGLRFRGCPRQEMERRVEAWLERLGILALARRSAQRLSGGQAQRVSLARALVLEPRLLLLDEPFADLDPPTREGLIGELRPILRERGTTAVFVTHDRNEALALADRLAIMMGGRILQVGPPQEVFARPASQEVASFIGTETILPGQVVGSSQGLMEIEVAPSRRVAAVGQSPVGSEVLVCIRPEEVTLIREGHSQERSSARNRFPALVREMADLGPYFRVSLDAGFPLVAYATRASITELGLGEGQALVATFKATAVHIIAK